MRISGILSFFALACIATATSPVPISQPSPEDVVGTSVNVETREVVSAGIQENCAHCSKVMFGCGYCAYDGKHKYSCCRYGKLPSGSVITMGAAIDGGDPLPIVYDPALDEVDAPKPGSLVQARDAFSESQQKKKKCHRCNVGSNEWCQFCVCNKKGDMCCCNDHKAQLDADFAGEIEAAPDNNPASAETDATADSTVHERNARSEAVVVYSSAPAPKKCRPCDIFNIPRYCGKCTMHLKGGGCCDNRYGSPPGSIDSPVDAGADPETTAVSVRAEKRDGPGYSRRPKCNNYKRCAMRGRLPEGCSECKDWWCCADPKGYSQPAEVPAIKMEFETPSISVRAQKHPKCNNYKSCAMRGRLPEGCGECKDWWCCADPKRYSQPAELPAGKMVVETPSISARSEDTTENNPFRIISRDIFGREDEIECAWRVCHPDFPPKNCGHCKCAINRRGFRLCCCTGKESARGLPDVPTTPETTAVSKRDISSDSEENACKKCWRYKNVQDCLNRTDDPTRKCCCRKFLKKVPEARQFGGMVWLDEDDGIE